MSQPIIDIGILTIRDDEFRAVLNAFADAHGIYVSGGGGGCHFGGPAGTTPPMVSSGDWPPASLN